MEDGTRLCANVKRKGGKNGRENQIGHPKDCLISGYRMENRLRDGFILVQASKASRWFFTFQPNVQSTIANYPHRWYFDAKGVENRS